MPVAGFGLLPVESAGLVTEITGLVFGGGKKGQKARREGIALGRAHRPARNGRSAPGRGQGRQPRARPPCRLPPRRARPARAGSRKSRKASRKPSPTSRASATRATTASTSSSSAARSRSSFSTRRPSAVANFKCLSVQEGARPHRREILRLREKQFRGRAACRVGGQEARARAARARAVHPPHHGAAPARALRRRAARPHRARHRGLRGQRLPVPTCPRARSFRTRKASSR